MKTPKEIIQEYGYGEYLNEILDECLSFSIKKDEIDRGEKYYCSNSDVELFKFIKTLISCKEVNISGVIETPMRNEVKGQKVKGVLSPTTSLYILESLARILKYELDIDIIEDKGKIDEYIKEAEIASRRSTSGMTVRESLKYIFLGMESSLKKKKIFGVHRTNDLALLYDLAVSFGLLGRDNSLNKKEKYTYVKDLIRSIL